MGLHCKNTFRKGCYGLWHAPADADQASLIHASMPPVLVSGMGRAQD